ncbi:family 16 glycosylhydrolase [Colwellia sp. E2M01]|nr:family 16 glycosylhydrolase [Colwellia sp. E2M01]
MIKATKKLTLLFACISTTTLFGCGGVDTKATPSTVDPLAPVSDWKMVWNDEFDGTTIDSTKWTHEVNCDGGGNNEKQCYTDSSENSYVEDGMLNIKALAAAEGAEQPFTSARLITQNKADFKYGRFEMRAKLPSGQGSWPAFWMMPTDAVYGGWPHSGEIDIMEAVNLKVADEDGAIESSIWGTLHYGESWPDNSHSGKEYPVIDSVNPADEFKVYAVEWQEGEIRWYIDGHLYGTQRQSEVRYNSKDEAVGLAHRGWFAEYFDRNTGELATHWDAAPFDQDFFMILNFAVGGDWPENVNNTGVDADAVAGQSFQVDYVRVYQCIQNTDTGKGCETVRGGYDSLDDALVEGEAPTPKAPVGPTAENLTIYSGSNNPNWPAWDCCGGSTPATVVDADKGNVIEFLVAETPTVNGFITRAEFITDDSGQVKPFDGSLMVDSGKVTFDLKIVTAPNDTTSPWSFKAESDNGDTAVDFLLSESEEAAEPVVGEWQTYTYSLQTLQDNGLDVSAIDVLMFFPAWGTGEGAVYQVTNVKIESDQILSPSVTVFEDEQNASWPMWDCCGGTTPTVEIDDDEHGAVAEFSIGESPTVMGFISRSEFTDTPAPFDATGILSNGIIQFDMKVVSLPTVSDATWSFKVESDNADSEAAVDLTASVEGKAPVEGEWQTYTFNLSDLVAAGLDASAIDVLMVFPAWGSGADAIYRIDNMKIYDPTASTGFSGYVLFDDAPRTSWSIWDCCGGTTPTVENDDTEHGNTAEFVIGADPTVMGILADDDVYLDVSALQTDGVVQFEMKVVSAPIDTSADWLFKIESGDAASAVELNLSDSQEGVNPTVGEWQTYTYSLQSLFDAGLDLSAVDVLMVFPAWGAGEGATYRLDNIMIFDPSSVSTPQGLTIFDESAHTDWPAWDCCAGSTPAVVDDGSSHNMVTEFAIGSTPTVMGFLANDSVSYDATAISSTGSVTFDMKVVTPPTDTSGTWLFKVESGSASAAVELELSASQEGVAPTVGEWQTYTFLLSDLFAAGLDVSDIDVLMVFPTWGTGDGAVYRIDNVAITAP